MNIDKIFRKAERLGADYCDIRIAEASGTTLTIKKGELEKAISGGDVGAGVRVLHRGNWGLFALEGEADIGKGLVKAVKLAESLSRKKKGEVRLAPAPRATENIPLRVKKDPRDVDISAKVELLSDLIGIFKGFKELNSMEVGLDDGIVKNKFYSSEGTEISYYQPSILVRSQLTAKGEKGLVGYGMRHGGTAGYEMVQGEELKEKAEEAARSTVRLLKAGAAPSGRFTVIADPDLAGVFAHEAVGHATEGDLVLSGDSILKGRIGERLGSELVTIFDDPTMPMGFGSFPYDDEGIISRRKILIENGILRDFLNNRETARRLDMEPNGSARAQSSGSSPLVRMSNTMIANGNSSFEELIEDITFGVYLKGSRGGQVDTAKGMFQFNAEEGFLIEKGELGKPLRDVSLSGFTLDTLNNIDAIGNDFQFGSPGFCGKGQLVPVGDGGPHIRIVDAIVGGM